jgi:hypothetical protein
MVSEAVTSSTPSPMVYLSPPQSEDFVMNTRTYEIGKTAEQADSQRDQASSVVELGTVTHETKQIAPPVTMDSPFTVGNLGG